MLFEILTSRLKIVSTVFKTSSCFFKISQCKFCVKMENLLKPPDTVRGLKKLDKNLFAKDIEVAYLSLQNTKVSVVLPLVKKYVLKLENFRPVKHLDSESHIYLNPNLLKQWSNFPNDIQTKLNEAEVSEDNLKNTCFTLTFDNYSVEDVFRAVLPQDQEGRTRT